MDRTEHVVICLHACRALPSNSRQQHGVVVIVIICSSNYYLCVVWRVVLLHKSVVDVAQSCHMHKILGGSTGWFAALRAVVLKAMRAGYRQPGQAQRTTHNFSESSDIAKI